MSVVLRYQVIFAFLLSAMLVNGAVGAPECPKMLESKLQEKFVCPISDGSFPLYEGACTNQHHYCSEGYAHQMNCPTDYLFDATIGTCSPLEQVECFASVNFTCPQSSGNYPIPDYCGPSFYTCIGGIPYCDACPPGSIFRPDNQTCVGNNSYTCPIPLNCTENGNYAFDYEACSSSYYQCLDGTIFNKTCPGNDNFFDPVVGRCEPIETIQNCKDKCSAGGGQIPLENKCIERYIDCKDGDPSIKSCNCNQLFDPLDKECKDVILTSCWSCPAPTGFFPIPDKCGSEYVACVDNTTYKQECPGGTLFDPESLRCDSVQSVSCWKCPEPNGDFPITDGCCDQFYVKCTNGTPSGQTCANGEFFSAGTCQSTCSTSNDTDEDVTSDALNDESRASCNPQSFVCKADGDFPIPYYCGPEYYTCIGLDTYCQTCPKGYVFHPEERECVVASAYDCPVTCTEDGKLPISNSSCSTDYYWCIDGKRNNMTCPGRNIFDPETLACQVIADVAVCKERCPSANLMLPLDEKNCTSLYIQCTAVHTPSIKECPNTFPLFDAVTKKCVTVEQSCWICPSPDGFFPIPDKCSGTFTACVGGKRSSMTCPNSGIFDPKTLVCTTSPSCVPS